MPAEPCHVCDQLPDLSSRPAIAFRVGAVGNPAGQHHVHYHVPGLYFWSGLGVSSTKHCFDARALLKPRSDRETADIVGCEPPQPTISAPLVRLPEPPLEGGFCVFGQVFLPLRSSSIAESCCLQRPLESCGRRPGTGLLRDRLPGTVRHDHRRPVRRRSGRRGSEYPHWPQDRFARPQAH